MVDALSRARRWLAPQGGVVDLRPAEVVPCIEIGLPDGTVVPVGKPVVDEERRARHRAANNALETVLDRGLFRVKDEEKFPFVYYPESPEELRDYLATKWKHTRIDDRTFAQTVAAVHAHSDGRLWLRELVGIRTLVAGIE